MFFYIKRTIFSPFMVYSWEPTSAKSDLITNSNFRYDKLLPKVADTKLAVDSLWKAYQVKTKQVFAAFIYSIISPDRTQNSLKIASLDRSSRPVFPILETNRLVKYRHIKFFFESTKSWIFDPVAKKKTLWIRIQSSDLIFYVHVIFCACVTSDISNNVHFS